MVRVAINGYGRIGRVAHRVILLSHTDEIDVVAINAGSSTDITGWMYLLKYDTVYGALQNTNLSVKKAEEVKLPFESQALPIGALIINSKEIPVFSEKEPEKLPWRDLNVDVVIESTGHFTTNEGLQKHITAGSKAAILSAPYKDEASGSTYVLGVNLPQDGSIRTENIVSNASCTTNCITPIAHVIEQAFGIEKAMMTTIHGYTSDQRIQDGGHKDYRRARAAAENIIPTSTGATKAAAKAIPTLEGKFNGLAIRVPVPTGSLSDFTFLVKRNTTVEEVNQALEQASKEPQFEGILQVTHDPIVSSDIIGNYHSAIADLSLTQVVGGNMVKVIAWYDNEFGYSNRLVEEAIILGKQVLPT
ncbi:MAG: type I glyceraldehyde-3-phosphate dehydrogenase [Candidatus Levybacteria bacterium RIFCSPHIGHO2_02_FULL_40_18]|nr:MAG: type I glyceraldehyde-3-phosphate dehydrogenase [Candidatus Levybacteria bacterium RIFCSPHIGHO2_01_FULL_40_58]OGH26169.1 MAG: type I glyceraldehyde-3-phosphate dehydrogenase [Candidatus Levybacteria bacterium RIFCSPHIGHO2_02_FULL_40_18]OGH31377.1 MAG: type I glyceraldehyde-3-phosphate dehydrogenase [Candidatus Levybacteria bacterium RIFCSPHIGHO2_12_FULL_40_31]OGH40052.1 MAG: type I glyceraldehyde-3-phosphate dehydrogenase [Candidatus Levybacteria bacterium RIFCSPLOWO2_01_FULL_40_64]OGH4